MTDRSKQRLPSPVPVPDSILRTRPADAKKEIQDHFTDLYNANQRPFSPSDQQKAAYAGWNIFAYWCDQGRQNFEFMLKAPYVMRW